MSKEVKWTDEWNPVSGEQLWASRRVQVGGYNSCLPEVEALWPAQLCGIEFLQEGPGVSIRPGIVSLGLWEPNNASSTQVGRASFVRSRVWSQDEDCLTKQAVSSEV